MLIILLSCACVPLHKALKIFLHFFLNNSCLIVIVYYLCYRQND